MNVKFAYRYRDYGNFKRYGSVVFGNRNEIPIEEIRRRILGPADGEWLFIASRLRVPELFFEDLPFDPDLDHQLHEFYVVSETDVPVSDNEGRDILALIDSMDMAAVA